MINNVVAQKNYFDPLPPHLLSLANEICWKVKLMATPTEPSTSIIFPSSTLFTLPETINWLSNPECLGIFCYIVPTSRNVLLRTFSCLNILGSVRLFLPANTVDGVG